MAQKVGLPVGITVSNFLCLLAFKHCKKRKKTNDARFDHSSTLRVETSHARTQNTLKSWSRNLKSQNVLGLQRKMLVSPSRIYHSPPLLPVTTNNYH